MALKVKLPSGMTTIDTTLHKPVTFVNGQKKIISKAVTFVNGTKKVLWGDEGVPLDYIKSDGVSCGTAFSAGENILNTSRGVNVTQLDISNLSSPQVIQQVGWGNATKFSGYQSTVNGMVFDGNADNNTTNRLVVDSDGNIQVPQAFQRPNIQLYYSRCLTDNYMVTTQIRSQSFVIPQTGGITTIRYGNDFYWNDQLKYQTGTTPTSVSNYTSLIIITDQYSISTGNRQNNFDIPRDACLIQNQSDGFLVNMTSNNDTLKGLYQATPTGITRLRANTFGLTMLDGNYFCGNDTTMETFALYDKDSFALVRSYTDAGWRLKLLGRIDDAYYLLGYKVNFGVYKILLLDKDDLSFIWEENLPADPFSENLGATTFWDNLTWIPQISITGFLCGSTYIYNGGVFRCVRIGKLSY